MPFATDHPYVLTASCPSRMGTTAAITGFLAARRFYLMEMHQFDDTISQRFFVRITFCGVSGEVFLDPDPATIGCVVVAPGEAAGEAVRGPAVEGQLRVFGVKFGDDARWATAPRQRDFDLDRDRRIRRHEDGVPGDAVAALRLLGGVGEGCNGQRRVVRNEQLVVCVMAAASGDRVEVAGDLAERELHHRAGRTGGRRR